MMDKKERFDLCYLRMARVMADTMSKDPATKVGAIIVTPDDHVVSIGYNGLSRGIKETWERWQRPEKYEWVVHAEQNALINARGRDVAGCTLYCTLKPCHRCLAHILNAGIHRIVWLKSLRPDSPRQDIVAEMISESGIEVTIYEEDFIDFRTEGDTKGP